MSVLVGTRVVDKLAVPVGLGMVTVWVKNRVDMIVVVDVRRVDADETEAESAIVLVVVERSDDVMSDGEERVKVRV